MSTYCIGIFVPTARGRNFTRTARGKGVIFIRYRLEDKPVVEEIAGKDGSKQLQVTVTDHILG